MSNFIIICCIIGLIFIYFNRNYFKSFFNNDNEYSSNENNPPFCFECNQGNEVCKTCEALKLWEEGKKDEARDVFFKDYR